MFIRLLRGGVTFAPDEPGGGAPVEGDSSDGSEVEEPVETEEPASEDPQGEVPGEEEQPGHDPEESEAEGKPKPKPGKMVPLATLIEMRKKVDERIKELEGKLEGMESQKPKVDPFEAHMSALPADPDTATDEGRQAADERAVLPIIHRRKDVLFPELKEHHQALGAILAVVDKLTFQVNQVLQTIDKEKLPIGLKHLDKIEQIREQKFKESGGRKYVNYGNAFDALQDQLKAEEEEAAASEEGIRKDERARSDRERRQARSATGSTGPVPAARVPRSPSGGRMTPAEIDRRIKSGQNILIQ